MGFPYFDLVIKAQNDLINEGLIKPRTSQEEVEEDKGLLTRRAGYYVNSSIDPSIGLLAKTNGNNSLGYSVDVLLCTDGTYWDIATDNGGMATPVNGGPSGPDDSIRHLWRAPTAELARINNDLSHLAPIYDEQKSVQFGLACNDVYLVNNIKIDPGMISVQSMRCAYDYYVKGLDWNTSFKKHINELRAVYSLPPI